MNELAVMDRKISGLEESVYLSNLEKMKSERERYFTEDYFINQTSEMEFDADQELKILLEEQMKASSDSTNVKKNDNL